MKALVENFQTEVQWHGLTRRVGDHEFEVYDLIVPPHEVSSATVVSDYSKYTEWLNNLPDEVFNDLRFHGHSHVNMGVSPSGIDNKYRKDLVTQMPTPQADDEDSFYIFMIFNKRGEWSGEIYDLKYNTLYSTADIDIDVYCGEQGWLSEFVYEAKKVAVEAKATPKPVYKGVAGDSKYSYDPQTGAYTEKTTKKTSAKKKSEWTPYEEEPYQRGYDYSAYYGYVGSAGGYEGGWDE